MLPVRTKSQWPTWQELGWVTLIAVAMSLLDTAHTFFKYSAVGDALPWKYILVRIQMLWLIYPFLIPPIFVLARRFRMDREGYRNAFIHLAASFVFGYLHVTATGLVISSTGLAYPAVSPIEQQHFSSAFGPEVLRVMRVYFPFDLIVYWAIVGVVYAFHYYSESQQREMIALQLQASLTRARLQALRSQLNPHFLFNTLNTISVLAMKGDRDGVAEVLERLSILLRLCLDETRPQQVPLASELEFAEGYLEIQRIRFADRLTIRRHISPDTLNALVPCMIDPTASSRERDKARCRCQMRSKFNGHRGNSR